ncbi:helix-turn-helix domain-containing protein [Vreelandella subglaciescola]|jgi:transcriptional regulator with XRE-family HTH domain|uniref:Helix-turn-helix domain-containing protein n=1 Tax=Vreelandella subglaciescola TaxID=29571 RepID=A0A1M7ICK5_9GAMM|nr:helix-turn-helix domain-containing protein [Halomonas subglaciescola]SHM38430.1 Helix-turn-helix domain-containing protein [Halomonas subglaciescola]
MESLGARIKHFRLKAGLSKAALARHVGVSDVTVSYWESGAIKQVGHERLVALADALSCPLNALLEGEGSTPLAVLLHTGSLPWEQRQAMPTDPGKLPLDVPWEGEAFLATPAPNTRFAPLKTGDLALLGPTTRFHHAGHYLIQRDEMTEITHLLQAPSTTTPLCGVLLAHWRKQ